MNHALITIYRTVRNALLAERMMEYPKDAVVRVNSDRFKGVGVSCGGTFPDCPIDYLPVRLENGNTWYYPAEDCRRVHDLKTLNKSERRQILQARGRNWTTTCGSTHPFFADRPTEN